MGVDGTFSPGPPSEGAFGASGPIVARGNEVFTINEAGLLCGVVRGDVLQFEPVLLFASSRAFAVGDVNADDTVDVVAAVGTTLIVVYVDGDCGVAGSISVPLAGALTAAAVSDIDDDNDADIVITLDTDELQVLYAENAAFLAPTPFGDGTGSPPLHALVGAPARIAHGGPAQVVVLSEGGTVRTQLSIFAEPQIIASRGDIDGDLVADLAVADGSEGSLMYFFGANYTPGPVLFTGESVRDSALVDANGDGAQDILALGVTTTSVFLNAP